MKAYFIVLTLLLIHQASLAQDLHLPANSPAASVSYTVGYTEIGIKYSSPAVRDREIWGRLVPYDKVWSAGANEATTVSFSTDINIEGTILGKGTYSFFLVPQQGDEWIAVFNSEMRLRDIRDYDKAKDVARIHVPVKYVNVKQERLTYEIVDQNPEQGYIRMAWDKARVYLRFRVNVVEEAMEQVDAALEHARQDQKWMILARGAEFLLETGKQIGQAMDWADESSDLKQACYNWWIRARVLAKKEMFIEAIESGKKAIEYGKMEPADSYYKLNEPQIRKQMESWVQLVNSGGD